MRKTFASKLISRRWFLQADNVGTRYGCVIGGTHEEITEPERISYSANLSTATVQMTIEFIEHGKDKTQVVLTQVGFPDDELPKIVA